MKCNRLLETVSLLRSLRRSNLYTVRRFCNNLIPDTRGILFVMIRYSFIFTSNETPYYRPRSPPKERVKYCTVVITVAFVWRLHDMVLPLVATMETGWVVDTIQASVGVDAFHPGSEGAGQTRQPRYRRHPAAEGEKNNVLWPPFPLGVLWVISISTTSRVESNYHLTGWHLRISLRWLSMPTVLSDTDHERDVEDHVWQREGDVSVKGSGGPETL